MQKQKSGDPIRAWIGSAWNFWLFQHTPDLTEACEVAARAAMGQWLNENGDALIAAIAREVAKQSPG